MITFSPAEATMFVSGLLAVGFSFGFLLALITLRPVPPFNEVLDIGAPTERPDRPFPYRDI